MEPYVNEGRYATTDNFFTFVKLAKNWSKLAQCVNEASAAKQIRTALFWLITQREAAISYQRCGTTYRSHIHGSITQKSAVLKLAQVLSNYKSFQKRNSTFNKYAGENLNDSKIYKHDDRKLRVYVGKVNKNVLLLSSPHTNVNIANNENTKARQCSI